MLKPKSKKRNCLGISIAEFGAVLVIGLPLLLGILYVTLETAIMFTIRTNIDVAARNAARQLAIAYGNDRTVATDTTKQGVELNKIRIARYVEQNSQFKSVQFMPAANPTSVEVICEYGGGTLPPFPNPDVLNLSSSFKVQSTAVFPLE